MLRPCTITVVRNGSYPLSVSQKLPMYCSCQCVLSVLVRPGTLTIILCSGMALVSFVVQLRTEPLYDHTARGGRLNHGNCP